MPASAFIREKHVIDFFCDEFMYIFDCSRPYFQDSDLEEKFYFDIDTGMDAVFPKLLNKIEFNKMYNALEQGLTFYTGQCTTIDSDKLRIISKWKHFLNELRKDERYSGSITVYTN